MTNVKVEKKVERVNVYVDGFNLYFGMMDAGLHYCKWLSMLKLITNLKKPHQTISKIKYFTSKVSNNPAKQKRQTTYIEALETEGVEIFYGRYQVNDVECHRCHNIWREPNEKMTDVNIATEMVADAFINEYDVAILISGDSDLVPPIRAIHKHFHHKRVTVFFPPQRYNNSVAAVAKGNLTLGRKSLVASQLAHQVTKKSGFVLQKPSVWN